MRCLRAARRASLRRERGGTSHARRAPLRAIFAACYADEMLIFFYFKKTCMPLCARCAHARRYYAVIIELNAAFAYLPFLFHLPRHVLLRLFDAAFDGA